MIDVFDEPLIDFTDAARDPLLINLRTGKPCNLSQIYRYVHRGARNLNGDRVKLEVVKLPGGLRTSREAIKRFVQALNTSSTTGVPSSSRKARAAQAERELVAAGFEVGEE